MGEMRIADPVAGDLKVIWDPKKRDEVEAARNQFDALIKKGYLAFKVKKDGGKGQKVTEFDEDYEMLIMSPALQGG
jgi:ribosomal protein L19E